MAPGCAGASKSISGADASSREDREWGLHWIWPEDIAPGWVAGSNKLRWWRGGGRGGEEEEPLWAGPAPGHPRNHRTLHTSLGDGEPTCPLSAQTALSPRGQEYYVPEHTLRPAGTGPPHSKSELQTSWPRLGRFQGQPRRHQAGDSDSAPLQERLMTAPTLGLISTKVGSWVWRF